MFKKKLCAASLVLFSGVACATSELSMGLGYIDSNLNLEGQGLDYSITGKSPTISMENSEMTQVSGFSSMKIISSFAADDVEIENYSVTPNDKFDYFRAEANSGPKVGDGLFLFGISHERYKYGLAEYGATGFDLTSLYRRNYDFWRVDFLIMASFLYADIEVDVPGAKFEQDGFAMKLKAQLETCHQSGNGVGFCLNLAAQGQQMANDDKYDTELIDIFAGIKAYYSFM